MMNLDTYTKHIDQLLCESFQIVKQILVWDRGSIIEHHVDIA
jgi:hypothetical protein